MATTRRRFVQGSVAAATLMAAPAIGRASETPAAAKTLKAVMQGDLRSFDPIWTTANISSYHGALIYDTLFGVDANDKPQPQMVESFGTSDDQLTWTFKLRDGLELPRRLAGHGRRLCRLDPPLGGARRRRPAHVPARQGHRRQGRQDLHGRLQRALSA